MLLHSHINTTEVVYLVQGPQTLANSENQIIYSIKHKEDELVSWNYAYMD